MDGDFFHHYVEIRAEAGRILELYDGFKRDVLPDLKLEDSPEMWVAQSFLTHVRDKQVLCRAA